MNCNSFIKFSYYFNSLYTSGLRLPIVTWTSVQLFLLYRRYHFKPICQTAKNKKMKRHQKANACLIHCILPYPLIFRMLGLVPKTDTSYFIFAE